MQKAPDSFEVRGFQHQDNIKKAQIAAI